MKLLGWACVVWLVACGDDEASSFDAGAGADAAGADAAGVDAAGGDAAGSDAAGPTLQIDGVASAAEEGTDDRVECTIFAIVDSLVIREDGWTGRLAGEVIRRAFRGEEPLVEFAALIGGEVSLARDGRLVELRLAGEQPDDAPPFWRELEVLTGSAVGELGGEGAWTCAPILPDDPRTEDPEIDAPGTWSVAPR